MRGVMQCRETGGNGTDMGPDNLFLGRLNFEPEMPEGDNEGIVGNRRNAQIKCKESLRQTYREIFNQKRQLEKHPGKHMAT
jgi:hypothetical protein